MQQIQVQDKEFTTKCILGSGLTNFYEQADHFVKMFKVPRAHQERILKIYHHLLSGNLLFFLTFPFIFSSFSSILYPANFIAGDIINAAFYKVFINGKEVDKTTILNTKEGNTKIEGTLLLVIIIFPDNLFVRLEVYPKGKTEIPATSSRLFTAITDLLAYLDSLHKYALYHTIYVINFLSIIRKKLVHRDLRWPNILYNPQTGHYFVIDHETASPESEYSPLIHFPPLFLSISHQDVILEPWASKLL